MKKYKYPLEKDVCMYYSKMVRFCSLVILLLLVPLITDTEAKKKAKTRSPAVRNKSLESDAENSSELINNEEDEEGILKLAKKPIKQPPEEGSEMQPPKQPPEEPREEPMEPPAEMPAEPPVDEPMEIKPEDQSEPPPPPPEMEAGGADDVENAVEE
ncbi:hypothetical protein D917_00235 [Trichinella nativa]|uniref:Uncharacterized protein n=1 Tax=Trichinella nativa TaxID=6335 RepID=A0A1Y3EJW1_9BILA|nr:hypothetical protein D917_00235 [Trichinella nativa]